MNGMDIARARAAAHINQADLAAALSLTGGGRGSLTDIESGAIEVTPGYVLTAIGLIEGMRVRRNSTVAVESAA